MMVMVVMMTPAACPESARSPAGLMLPVLMAVRDPLRPLLGA
jgi:hypothetical protein